MFCGTGRPNHTKLTMPIAATPTNHQNPNTQQIGHAVTIDTCRAQSQDGPHPIDGPAMAKDTLTELHFQLCAKRVGDDDGAAA